MFKFLSNFLLNYNWSNNHWYLYKHIMVSNFQLFDNSFFIFKYCVNLNTAHYNFLCKFLNRFFKNLNDWQLYYFITYIDQYLRINRV